MKKVIALVAGLSLLAGAFFKYGVLEHAVAQVTTVTAPTVANVGSTDLFQDVVNGTAQVPTYYATAAQINGVVGYQNLGVATSGNTYTFGNSTTNIFMQPAGTLAAVTLIAAANPGDGQRECFLSTQTTTTLTWNANTGQSINGAPTAGVANTPACMQYSKATATWYRAP